MGKMRELWAERQELIDPDEPDTVGGMGVIHQYRTITPPLRRFARTLKKFYLAHWQWIWTTAIGIPSVVGAILALGCD